jgi:hypothetical protein
MQKNEALAKIAPPVSPVTAPVPPPPAPAAAPPPAPPAASENQEKLLAEIRDLLKQK